MAAKCYALKQPEKDQELILLSQVLWQSYLLLKQLWIQQSKRFKFMVVMGT
jgi:hypothetical protein